MSYMVPFTNRLLLMGWTLAGIAASCAVVVGAVTGMLLVGLMRSASSPRPAPPVDPEVFRGPLPVPSLTVPYRSAAYDLLIVYTVAAVIVAAAVEVHRRKL